jgi:hypothetical protein
MTAPDEAGVWVFNGDGGSFPAAVFTAIEKADRWIARRKLSGTLTWYPLDTGVYEWVIEQGRWVPSKDYQKTPEFIQSFSSAYTGHYHYENGSRDGRPDQNDPQATN